MKIHWILFIWFTSVVQATKSGLEINSFPDLKSENNSLLAFIHAFDFLHLDPLLITLIEYVSLCESGWNVSIIIVSTKIWKSALQTSMRSKAFCYRSRSSIPIRYMVHQPGQNETEYSILHSDILLNEIQNYDVFIYHNDDVLFRHAHIIAYYYESKKLLSYNEKIVNDYIISFQRYFYRSRKLDEIKAIDWTEKDILQQHFFDEVMNYSIKCINNKYYLDIISNCEEKELWIITQYQLQLLHNKCQLLHSNSLSALTR